MSAKQPAPPVCLRLAELCAGPVGPIDRSRAVLHLIDWIGCAVAGRASPVGAALSQVAGQGGPGRAFLWGGLGNLLEMDDVDRQALLHPGPTVIPAALAASLATSNPQGDVLAAITAGYEAVIRLGRAVGLGHYRLWHSTATCGPAGAAVAACHMRGLNPAATAHALAAALSQAAGFWHTRHDPTAMGKQLHTAHAARAGVDAAALAQAGFIAPLAILEGPQGFFAATCPGADPQTAVADLSGWRLHEVSFKPWAACRHVHPTIDAARLLRVRLAGGRLPDAIRVETYADALKFCDKPAPRTTLEAKFSLQHAVAVAVLTERPCLADFTPEAAARADLTALRARVEVAESPALTAAYPRRFGARLTARWGAEQAVFDVPDALGDPENPLDDAGIWTKARELMAYGGLAPTQVEALLGLAVALVDRPDSLPQLTTALRGALP